jgi:hypothetical protein
VPFRMDFVLWILNLIFERGECVKEIIQIPDAAELINFAVKFGRRGGRNFKPEVGAMCDCKELSTPRVKSKGTLLCICTKSSAGVRLCRRVNSRLGGSGGYI